MKTHLILLIEARRGMTGKELEALFIKIRQDAEALCIDHECRLLPAPATHGRKEKEPNGKRAKK